MVGKVASNHIDKNDTSITYQSTVNYHNTVLSKKTGLCVVSSSVLHYWALSLCDLPCVSIYIYTSIKYKVVEVVNQIWAIIKLVFF